MQESGYNLLQVINDILDYSKLASGCFSICSDVVDISDVIGSLVRGFHTAINPDVSLETSLEPRIPKSAHGDPLRYRQIVQNLVANAVKFTETGFIHIHESVTHDNDTSNTILKEFTEP